jgi:hypothetical protein
MMTPTWDESYLRARLRAEWKSGPLVWVEAADGGTDGAADVFVPVKGQGFIPVELKKWEVDKYGNVKVEARPSQRRFHRLCEAANMPSFVLVLLSNMKVVLFPGRVMTESYVHLTDDYKLKKIIGMRIDDLSKLGMHLAGGF